MFLLRNLKANFAMSLLRVTSRSQRHRVMGTLSPLSFVVGLREVATNAVSRSVLCLLQVLTREYVREGFVFPYRNVRSYSKGTSLHNAKLPSRGDSDPFVSAPFLVQSRRVSVGFRLVSGARALKTDAGQVVGKGTPEFSLVGTSTTVQAKGALARVRGLPIRDICCRRAVHRVRRNFGKVKGALLCSQFRGGSVRGSLGIVFSVLVRLSLLEGLVRVSISLRSRVSTSSNLVRGFGVNSLTTPRCQYGGLSLLTFQGHRSLVRRLVCHLFTSFPSAFKAIQSSRANVRGSRVVMSLHCHARYEAKVPIH